MLARRLLRTGTGGFTVPANLLALYNGESGPGVYAIGAATFNGSAWSEYGSNPVLQKGAAATWDADHVKDPWLMWDGSQYVCYYAGYDGTKYQVGRATASSITGTWTKDAANPVVAVGSGGSIDDTGVAFPTVRYDASMSPPWQMWYRADEGTDQVIAYADSTNGVAWTKRGAVLSLGAAGQWDDVGLLPGAIFYELGTYTLFYGGRQNVVNPRWQTGVATFTSPTGAYTRHASNPIAKSRFNDTGTSQALTATTTASAIVTVASTAAWSVGEPVVITDADTETEVRSIASIDSGTQVTLNAATTGTYTAAQGAVLRSFAYNSLTPRAIRARPTGDYELFVSPFQPVDDLTTTGNSLWEGSMRMTSAALTGPWSFDYSTGLMFPLGVPGATWDSVSAENPSVIATP